MKHFLPLFILTSFLFGQDTTLVLKNGKIIEGTIVSETDNYYTIIVKSTSGGLINVDLPFFFGVRKDIYKIETLDRKEAKAILNARNAGVNIWCITLNVSNTEITFNQEIPVNLEITEN